MEYLPAGGPIAMASIRSLGPRNRLMDLGRDNGCPSVAMT
jgi:hypothetical protein